MSIYEGLTYDDVLLVPKYSEVETRSTVDLSVDLGKGVKLDIPIITANMADVTGPEMARSVAKLGGLGLLHRFCTLERQVEDFKKAAYYAGQALFNNIGCSLGVKEEDKERLKVLYQAGCKIFCIDVAHGHNKNCGDMTSYVAKKYNDVLLISGNVATPEGAKYLADCGADVIKAGIGPGSLCSTRVETGNGVPQLTALQLIAMDRKNRQMNYKIIADGGLKKAGDLTKALCFADTVMLGSLLAGTSEAPGQNVTIDGITYKQYRGSSTLKDKHIEGVQGLVPLKGPVSGLIDKLLQGLKSGCSYQGCDNLADLKKDPTFVKISNSGLLESHPHSVILK